MFINLNPYGCVLVPARCAVPFNAPGEEGYHVEERDGGFVLVVHPRRLSIYGRIFTEETYDGELRLEFVRRCRERPRIEEKYVLRTLGGVVEFERVGNNWYWFKAGGWLGLRRETRNHYRLVYPRGCDALLYPLHNVTHSWECGAGIEVEGDGVRAVCSLNHEASVPEDSGPPYTHSYCAVLGPLGATAVIRMEREPGCEYRETHVVLDPSLPIPRI